MMFSFTHSLLDRKVCYQSEVVGDDMPLKDKLF